MNSNYNARLALSCALGFGIYDEITIGDNAINMKKPYRFKPVLKVDTEKPERKAHIRGKTKKEKKLKKKRGY